MDCYLGVVFYFGGNYTPRNFAQCLGQLLAISQNSALFAVLGTAFGGDGQTTFALPHLGGRVPVGQGRAPGVSNSYFIGQVGGVEQSVMTSQQMPMHVHSLAVPFNLQALSGVGASDELASPEAGHYLGVAADSNGQSSPVIYAPAGSGTAVNLAGGMVSGTTGAAGGNQPFSLMQPYLGLTALICTMGLFPSRN